MYDSSMNTICSCISLLIKLWLEGWGLHINSTHTECTNEADNSLKYKIVVSKCKEEYNGGVWDRVGWKQVKEAAKSNCNSVLC